MITTPMTAASSGSTRFQPVRVITRPATRAAAEPSTSANACRIAARTLMLRRSAPRHSSTTGMPLATTPRAPKTSTPTPTTSGGGRGAARPPEHPDADDDQGDGVDEPRQDLRALPAEGARAAGGEAGQPGGPQGEADGDAVGDVVHGVGDQREAVEDVARDDLGHAEGDGEPAAIAVAAASSRRRRKRSRSPASTAFSSGSWSGSSSVTIRSSSAPATAAPRALRRRRRRRARAAARARCARRRADTRGSGARWPAKQRGGRGGAPRAGGPGWSGGRPRRRRRGGEPGATTARVAPGRRREELELGRLVATRCLEGAGRESPDEELAGILDSERHAFRVEEKRIRPEHTRVAALHEAGDRDHAEGRPAIASRAPTWTAPPSSGSSGSRSHSKRASITCSTSLHGARVATSRGRRGRRSPRGPPRGRAPGRATASTTMPQPLDPSPRGLAGEAVQGQRSGSRPIAAAPRRPPRFAAAARAGRRRAPLGRLPLRLGPGAEAQQDPAAVARHDPASRLMWSQIAGRASTSGPSSTSNGMGAKVRNSITAGRSRPRQRKSSSSERAARPKRSGSEGCSRCGMPMRVSRSVKSGA